MLHRIELDVDCFDVLCSKLHHNLIMSNDICPRFLRIILKLDTMIYSVLEGSTK